MATANNHICALKTDGSITCLPNYPFSTLPSGSFTQLSVGYQHGNSCAVKSGSGSIVCWRGGEEGTPPAGNFTKVSVGYDHSCAVKSDGSIACWGNSSFGKTTPPMGNNFTQVSAGFYHSCAVKSNGAVLCWGEDVPPMVTVEVQGNGTVSAPGIQCGASGSDCSELYQQRNSVTLTATPAAGAVFSGWSGGVCEGTQPTCTLAMSNVWQVKAQFTNAAGASTARIINLSVSDMVNPNLNMGFIAQGAGTVKVLLRAWNLEFAGIPSVDPLLTVKKGGVLVASNDSWQVPAAPCQAIPANKQQAEFADARNAACYLDINPNEGYVIELTSKNGNVARAQLSADVDASGSAALVNASTTFSIDASNRGNAGMGLIVSGNGQLRVLPRIWNLGFAGISANTNPSLLLRNGTTLATLATNEDFASVSGACAPVTHAMLVNPEFYNEPRNAACLTSIDANQPIHLLGNTSVDGRIQMSLDLQ